MGHNKYTIIERSILREIDPLYSYRSPALIVCLLALLGYELLEEFVITDDSVILVWLSSLIFLAFVLVGLWALLPMLRMNHRLKRDQCPRCGYDLRTVPDDGTCPECGLDHPATLERRSKRIAADRYTQQQEAYFMQYPELRKFQKPPSDV